MKIIREQFNTIYAALQNLNRFDIIYISGPRRIGKTTLVRDIISKIGADQCMYFATDDPTYQTTEDELFNLSPASPIQVSSRSTPASSKDLIYVWEAARKKARECANDHRRYYVLAIDEIQKVKKWSDVVKGLWDKDRATNIPLKVVILGSSPLLMQKGITESLAGRFQTVPMTHWSYEEMQKAFGLTLNEYIYFGGYPEIGRYDNRSPLTTDWLEYVYQSIINPSVRKDIFEVVRIDKPTQFIRLFELGCGTYASRPLSLTKLTQETETGNTTTLTHYLDILSETGFLTGLYNYKGTREIASRNSVPKFTVHNTAFTSALMGYTFNQALDNSDYWGRLVECAVGAHLVNSKPFGSTLHYWHGKPDNHSKRQGEVDYVIQLNQMIFGIEVKSNKKPNNRPGLSMFQQKYPSAYVFVVGGTGVPLSEFLLSPVDETIYRSWATTQNT